MRRSHQSETIKMMGITISVLKDATDTDGLATIMEQQVAPGAGSPLHSCGEAKIFYVLKGTFCIQMGEEAVVASKGCSVVIQAGIPHSFRNTGSSSGKLLVTVTPGGHEAFLRQLSYAVADGGDKRMMKNVAEAHGVTMYA